MLEDHSVVRLGVRHHAEYGLIHSRIMVVDCLLVITSVGEALSRPDQETGIIGPPILLHS